MSKNLKEDIQKEIQDLLLSYYGDDMGETYYQKPIVFTERAAQKAIELFMIRARERTVEVICGTGLREKQAVRLESLEAIAKEILE